MDDLGHALPDPPPPRPARRAEAIAAALERFDRGGTRPVGRAAPAPRSRGWRPTGRVQVAALASAALVALVAVPLALDHPGGRVAVPETPRSLEVADRAPAFAAPQAPPDAGAAPSRPRPTEPMPAAVTTPSRPSDAAVAAPPMPAPPAIVAPPPPPAAPPAPAPVVAEARAAVEGASQRASFAANDAANIVVTGSRMARPAKAAPPRRDWTACTLADPARSLRACDGLIRTGGGGAAGKAGAEVAEGLALGWRGDMTGALAAFDRAIALQPRLGIGHLNRGLAHERLGAADAALADLDRAVRFDPSAHSYRARSQARRERGDIAGARADQDRAADLDPDGAKAVDD